MKDTTKAKSVDLEDALEQEPWLRPWIEEGDEDLIQARVRFKQAERAAEFRMAREGITYRRRLEKGGVLTTALDMLKEGRK